MKQANRPQGRVLIVDDHPEVLGYLRFLLEEFGYEVVTVASGAEALARAEEAHFDLLVTDIHMPGMDGHELADAFARRHAGIPVLLISGCDPERPVQGPRRRFLHKPLDTESFLRTVAEMIGGDV